MKKNNKRFFIPLIAMAMASSGVVIGVHASNEINNDDKIHPYGNENVVIDYVECEDDKIKEYEIDDTVVVNYASTYFTDKNGEFIYDGTKKSYTSNETNSLAVCDDIPFNYGTFEAKLTRNTKTGDDGIVFGCFDKNKSSYWEGRNVSYYFYFVNQYGNVSLGKADNGSWTTMYETTDGAYKNSTNITLKVVKKGNIILLYVNGNRITYMKDVNILEGSKFGIRAGGTDVGFSNFIVKSTYEY